MIAVAICWTSAAMATSEDDVALVKAAGSGDLQKIKALLAKGADVNATSDGESALMAAAHTGKIDGIKLLLAKGAKLTTCTNDVGCLDPDEIWYAVDGGAKRDLIEMLLDNGAEFNHSTCQYTSLYFAARKANRDVVELLLEKKANSDDEASISALMLAAFKGNQDLVKILLDKHYDVNSTNDDSFTPLMLAAINGKQDVVKLLLA